MYFFAAPGDSLYEWEESSMRMEQENDSGIALLTRRARNAAVEARRR
jgi:hypothetical protein